MSDNVFTVTSSLVIDRPVERVRAQFFDVDRAIRDGIHQGVTMRWLAPKAPGERRLLQEVRVLGIPYADEIVVETTEDGALVKDFVEGPNKGARFIETFEPAGDGKTLAKIVATIPASGFKWAVGPLFRLAVRKALDKALAEHKRDIEGSYEPGRARGDLDAALASLTPVVERAKVLARDLDRVALFTPIIEAACVTAIADDEIDDAERDAIRAVIKTIGVSYLDDDAVEAVVASSVDRTRSDGVAKRCEDLGSKLKSMDLAEPGLSVATLVAQISHGVDQSELAALQRMAHAAGLGDDALAQIVDRIDRQLSRAG